MNESLLLMLQSLPDNKKNYVLSRQNEFKQTNTAYILWFLFGVHYFYLGRPFINILYWLTGAGLGVWAILDLFRIPKLIRDYNEKALQRILTEANTLYPNS